MHFSMQRGHRLALFFVFIASVFFYFWQEKEEHVLLSLAWKACVYRSLSDR